MDKMYQPNLDNIAKNEQPDPKELDNEELVRLFGFISGGVASLEREWMHRRNEGAKAAYENRERQKSKYATEVLRRLND